MNVVEYKQNLNRLIDGGELALPSNVPAEAFRNAAVVAFTDNPKLASCTPASLFQSIRRLAFMGLVPDGQEAAIVPFKAKDGNQWVEKAQAMPMVAGLIKRARNSAEVKDIRAHIVYQNEVDQGRFVYQTGDTELLTHDPILFGERGPAVGCYAIARLKGDLIVREFMSAADVDKVRRAGSSQKIFQKGQAPVISDEPMGIWKDWSEEMWKKSVIRRLCKRLSLSSEDRRAVMEEPDEFPEMRDVTPPRQSLQDRIAEQRATEQQDSAHPSPPDEAVAPDQQKGEPSDPGAAVEIEGELDLGGEDPMQSVLDGILEDLAAAEDAAAIDQVEELFADQIAEIEKSSDAAAEALVKARGEARARVK